MGRSLTGALIVMVSSMLMVVGLASPSSAHHNTIVGSVTCRTDGGWAVTWKVTNSEADKSVKFIESNRTSAVPVGTVLAKAATGTYTETITTKPTGDVTLTLKGQWTNGTAAVNSGTIPVGSFSTACSPTVVQQPTVPVTDECGPGNAVYGDVPTGPWTVVRNPDGSLVITANAGSVFNNGQKTITLPAPVDSNEACAPPATPPTTPPTTPPVTPPVTPPTTPPTSPPVTPPVTPPTTPPVTNPTPPATNPTTPPVESSIAVRAKVKTIDKCGRAGDLYKPIARPGVRYWVNGDQVKAGSWLRAKKSVVTVRATTVDAGVSLIGKQSWKLTFRTAKCAQAPATSPQTGA